MNKLTILPKYSILLMSTLSIIIIILLDSIWLTLNKNLYNKMIKKIQSIPITINFYAATITYIFIFLSFYLIIYPNIMINFNNNNTLKTNLFTAFKYGATFGLIVYGIYNFTNYSIFKNYNLNVAIIDTLWGTFIYFIAVLISIYLNKYYLNK